MTKNFRYAMALFPHHSEALRCDHLALQQEWPQSGTATAIRANPPVNHEAEHSAPYSPRAPGGYLAQATAPLP